MAYYLQMTWQHSLLGQKRKSGPPLGLRNLGNSCYLNSVLQCLTYTPPLANFCLKLQHSSSCDSATAVATSEKKSECAFCILEKRIARSLKIESSLDSPFKINNSLKIFAKHFRSGRQEDAHEFLRYVIDACHSTCLRLKKLRQQKRKGGSESDGDGNTVVKDIFGGALQSQVKCLSCEAESNKVDDIMDFSLDVLHSTSLKEALQRFFQPELLDGNNKYKCDSCKKLVTARKQMSILQAPNILVIQFKRFEGIFGGKIDKAISFEEILKLSSYMCKASQDPHPEYSLFGAIVHSGISSDSGHYYAYIKDTMGRWYCCNDSYVTHSTLEEVLSEKVYILFYSRTNQRQAPAKSGANANGSKSFACNGNGTSKIPELAHCGKPPRPVNVKQSFPECSQIKNSNMIEAAKVPSGPSRKLTVFEHSDSRRMPASTNIKIVINKRGSANNADMSNPINGGSNKEKNMLPTTDGNGVTKSNALDSTYVKVDGSCHLANGNGKHHGSTTRYFNGDHTTDDGVIRETVTRATDTKDSTYGDNTSPDDKSSLKRKLQDRNQCILLAEDAQSRVQVEEFKEGLGKEALSILQSCSWSEEVHEFMRSRKKLYAQETRTDPSHIDDMRMRLIADSKRRFLSQIPESLKATLIGRLRSFCLEKES